MKNFIIALLLIVANIATGIAQDNVYEKHLFQKSKEFNDSLSIYDDNKDYIRAERLLYNYVDWFYSLPSEYQQKYSFLPPSIYYNIACYQSIQNKQESAVQSLEKAYQTGYDNYRQLTTDTDLDNIRSNSKFQELSAKMREDFDFLYILRKAPGYTTVNQTDTLPSFSYTAPSDSSLTHLRRYFNLDSIAGSGDELSRIKNILNFVHDNIRHDGQHGNPQPADAITMYDACRDGSRGLNCRGLATVLNEMYLAVGIPSRFITCYPRTFINDCHVINAVYSSTLQKWLYVDPTWNALVYDENDTPLSVQEVRERIIDGRPLILHDDANWNNREKATVDDYLHSYMAKNLYYIQSCDNYRFRTESSKYPRYILLAPTGITPDYDTHSSVIINDDSWFWQSPQAN